MKLFQSRGQKPEYSSVELGRGADGIVVEVLDHPELVIKDMNHAFRWGRNRIALESRILQAVLDATDGRAATRVLNSGTDSQERSWLVRERVFDVEPRGSQRARDEILNVIFRIYPNADVNRQMLLDPKYDNLRWGYTIDNRTPRWILIDP